MQTFTNLPWTARSWLEIPVNSDFSIQNLPFGIFSTSEARQPRVGLALGEFIIDTAVLFDAGMLAQVPGLSRELLYANSLNSLLSASVSTWRALRVRVAELFTQGNNDVLKNADLHARLLVKQSHAQLYLPTKVSNYVDFYSSREHATNVGAMFRDPQNPLLPNW